MKLSKLFIIVLPLILLQIRIQGAEQTPLDTANIKAQFDYVIKKASNYNNYRVIKSANINKLKTHVFDTIDGLNSKLLSANKLLLDERARTDSLLTALSTTKSNLAAVSEYKDSIAFFGNPLPKSTYNTILWSAIVALLSITIFTLILFKRSNSIYKRTKADLEEFKEELESNRRRSREREEKIVRKLHDEINKYKKKIYQLEKSGHGN